MDLSKEVEVGTEPSLPLESVGAHSSDDGSMLIEANTLVVFIPVQDIPA